MSIVYKFDVLAALKEKGYSQNRMRVEKLIGQSYLTQLRHGELVSWKAIETICQLLNCKPGDLLDYVPDEVPTARISNRRYHTMSNKEICVAMLDQFSDAQLVNVAAVLRSMKQTIEDALNPDIPNAETAEVFLKRKQGDFLP